MGSTVRTTSKPEESERLAAAVIRWRSWPLADNPRWSWLLPVAMLCIGVVLWSLGGGWFVPLVAILSMAMSLWQFLLPVTFEICATGVRRCALKRTRLVPWQAIRAYQLRSTGVVFFQRPDPTTIDWLNSLFVPYPTEEDEVVIAVRLYLPHAIELP